MGLETVHWEEVVGTCHVGLGDIAGGAWSEEGVRWGCTFTHQ